MKGAKWRQRTMSPFQTSTSAISHRCYRGQTSRDHRAYPKRTPVSPSTPSSTRSWRTNSKVIIAKPLQGHPEPPQNGSLQYVLASTMPWKNVDWQGRVTVLEDFLCHDIKADNFLVVLGRKASQVSAIHAHLRDIVLLPEGNTSGMPEGNTWGSTGASSISLIVMPSYLARDQIWKADLRPENELSFLRVVAERISLLLNVVI